MVVKITGGNVDDRKPLQNMVRGLRGKLFADKGYIGKDLLTKLWRNGLQLITGIRKTMKNYLMPWFDKVLLRKRFIIETLFDKLKIRNVTRTFKASIPRQRLCSYPVMLGSLLFQRK